MQRVPHILIGCACCLMVAACGGPPGHNPLLDEARSAYYEAEHDSLILTHAPVALETAKEDLRRSEQLQRENAGEEQVTHYAYLAKQRIRIAEEKARLTAAEQSIEQAELERKEVQLEARELEAEEAEREAQASEFEAYVARREAEEERQEAEAAKEAAEQAEARTRALAERIEELEAERTRRGLVLTLGDILFDVDKATLKPGGMRAANELAAFLQDYPERTVVIEGFTDNTGTEAYNLDLSRRRADAVRLALVANGIANDRIRIQGYGEAYPVATNTTIAGRQQNRRVEVIISDPSGTVPERVSIR